MSTGDDHQYGGRPPLADDYGGTGQTRTRMPDRAGPPHGGASRRPSRGLVVLAAVVALLIAAIAFANRGGGDDKPSQGAAGPTATDPTAPSGDRPGQARNTTGIPTGYAHSKEGAQSAAANYAVALGSDGMFAEQSRHDIVGTVYEAGAAAKRRQELDSVYSDKKFLTGIGLDAQGTAPEGQTFVSRTNPAGAKADTYEGDRATVSVWYSALFGLAGEGSTNPVSESWFTNTFQLVWVDGDWKVLDFTQKDGPTPVGRDQTASSAEDMTKAVQQFGGFTYAR